MAAPKGGSRERLLDAAEALFADKGFDATSIREIAAQAGDTIGTLSHHFGSKDRLLTEVVRRRFEALAEMRRSMYEGFRARSGGTPRLEDAIAAITVPFVERAMRGGQAWRSYTTLMSRMMYVGNPVHYKVIAELTDPLARELVGWLQAAEPRASLKDIGYVYQFIIGCVMDCCSQMENNRIHRITGGACSASDYDEIIGRFLLFVNTGARAVIGSGGAHVLSGETAPSRHLARPSAVGRGRLVSARGRRDGVRPKRPA
jgi:AcrR family transcriptional regulator